MPIAYQTYVFLSQPVFNTVRGSQCTANVVLNKVQPAVAATGSTNTAGDDDVAGTSTVAGVDGIATVTAGVDGGNTAAHGGVGDVTMATAAADDEQKQHAITVKVHCNLLKNYIDNETFNSHISKL
jgi:hypothetical protein